MKLMKYQLNFDSSFFLIFMRVLFYNEDNINLLNNNNMYGINIIINVNDFELLLY